MAKAKLSRLSLGELQAELDRRSRALARLQKQRDDLASKLAKLDQQIAALNGDAARRRPGPRSGPRPAAPKTAAPTSPTRRKRPKNRYTLIQMLQRVFPRDKPMKVSEAVAAVRKAGYKTSAKNFSVIVNQALLNDARFQPTEGRGYYRYVGE